MAEAILKAILKEKNIDKIEVYSAGTSVLIESAANDKAIEVAKKNALDLSGHKAKQIEEKMIKDARLILTMTTAHKEAIIKISPSSSDKVFTLKEFVNEVDVDKVKDIKELDISDPFGWPVEYYQKTYDEMYPLIKKITNKLK